MPRGEPEPIGGKKIPEHVLKHTYRDPPPETRLLVGPRWKVPQRNLLEVLKTVRESLPVREAPANPHDSLTLDHLVFKGRGNLAGELRRGLDQLVFEATAGRADNDEFYRAALQMRSTVSQQALALLRAWNESGARPIDQAFIDQVKQLDAELSNVSRILATGNPSNIFFQGRLDAIRREVLRQASERLSLEMGGDPSAAAGAGEKNASLLDHLTEVVVRTRTRVHTAGRELWSELAAKKSSSRLSSEMKDPTRPKPVRDFVLSAADAISVCERSIGDIIEDQARSETGEKMDAEGFTAICKTLVGVLEERMAAARNPDDPSRTTASPRQIEFVDQYLRQVASVLAEIVGAVPPRDWLDLPRDVEQRLLDAVGRIRKLDAPRPGSVEHALTERPGDLTGIWSRVSAAAVAELPAKERQQLQKAFGAQDLTAELKKFDVAGNPGEMEAGAWKIAQIVSDLMSELRALTFDREHRDAEAACVRMEEALTAIGAAVAAKIASAPVAV